MPYRGLFFRMMRELHILDVDDPTHLFVLQAVFLRRHGRETQRREGREKNGASELRWRGSREAPICICAGVCRMLSNELSYVVSRERKCSRCVDRIGLSPACLRCLRFARAVLGGDCRFARKIYLLT